MIQIKHLHNLRCTVAQSTPHEVLVEPAYPPYLNQLDIIIYAYDLLIIIVYVSKTI